MQAAPYALRHGAAAIGLLALAGCAGASVTGVSEVTAHTPPPQEILVEVDVPASASPDQGATARSIGSALGSDLVRQLEADHLAASERLSAALPRGDAVLRVTVTLADQGNKLRRMVIGFGAGKARLTATAALETADGVDLTRFDTSANSGMKPGLLLPGAVAGATGNLIHLAIGGGIDVAMNMRDGLAAPAQHTAGAIVKQLRTYYAAVGWNWPHAG